MKEENALNDKNRTSNSNTSNIFHYAHLHMLSVLKKPKKKRGVNANQFSPSDFRKKNLISLYFK